MPQAMLTHPGQPDVPRRSPAVGVPPKRLTPNAPIAITGATASFSWSGGAGTVTLGAAGMWIVGVTARFDCTAGSGDFTLDDKNLNFVGDQTATYSFVCYPGLAYFSGGSGSTVPGDQFYSPIIIGGLSGSLEVHPELATLEDFEINATFGGAIWEQAPTSGGSIWIVYVPEVSGELLLTAQLVDDYSSLVVFGGTTPNDLIATDDAIRWEFGPVTPDWVKTAVTAGQILILRIFGQSSFNPVDLTWQLTPGTGGELSVALDQTELIISPAVLSIQITSAGPNESLLVSVEGSAAGGYVSPSGTGLGVTMSILADDSGNASTSVPVPALLAGTYQVRVVGAASGTVEQSFQLLNAAQAAPTGPGGDSTPAPPTQVGVVKWVFQDPAPGGLGDYIFEINPLTMSDPHAPRNITWDHVASPTGPAVGWDSALRATEWRFGGTLKTQAQYDALNSFAALNRRFWIFDHLSRKWLVTIEQFSPAPKRDALSDWTHSYDVVALVFGEG